MHIGVLADTHDRLPDSVIERLAEVEEIWHLGDVCSSRILLSLEDKPIQIVRGNCDSSTHWPHALNLIREGIHFLLTHVPPMQAPDGIDVIIHGHTHIPRDEMVQGIRFLNPGSVSKPRSSKASFGILELENGVIASWKIMTI